VSQLGFMFPQHDCVLCRGTPDHGYGCTRPSISPAYIQQNLHPNIKIFTSTRVVDVAGQAGDFSVSLRQEPRYIAMERCINCGYCSLACPVELLTAISRVSLCARQHTRWRPRHADAYVIDRSPYCDECVNAFKCARRGQLT